MDSYGLYDDHVGMIVIKHASYPPHSLYIQPKETLEFGRADVQFAFGIEDKTVSSHLLQFHCVDYEEEPDKTEGPQVEPLVYVRVLSSKMIILRRPDSNNPSDECTLRRDSGDVLLNDGDALQLTANISVVYESRDRPTRPSTEHDLIRQQEVQRFADKYAVTDRLLGSGGYANVFVAVKQTTKCQLACKVVPAPVRKQANRNGDLKVAAAAQAEDARLCKKRDNLTREYDVLKDLSHPNIISLEKVFCTTHSIYIIQELITGGDLLSYADRPEPLSEAESAVVIRQVLKAVQYLHSHQIVHRDIKPENILMTSWRQGARVVLTDFGQARRLGDAKGKQKASALFRMQSIVGTHGYTAPEVFNQLRSDRAGNEGYSKAIDIWSVGCVAGTLLTAESMPFGRSEDEYTQANASTRRWDLSFMDVTKSWRALGSKVKAFVRGCLDVNESERFTAEQALMHEWFTNKHYAADLEAAYQRAIQDWKPRAIKGSLVEFIDTSDITIPDQKGGQCANGTRSYHFLDQAAQAKPSTSTFMRSAVYLPPPTKKHTPLSPIGASSSQSINLPASQAGLHASPICVPNTPPGLQPRTAESATFTPVEYDPLLERQLTVHGDASPPYDYEWPDSLNESPSLLDFPSPPQSALTIPWSGEPYTLKRTASLTQMDQSCMQATQYTADLDAPYVPKQRKVAQR